MRPIVAQAAEPNDQEMSKCKTVRFAHRAAPSPKKYVKFEKLKVVAVSFLLSFGRRIVGSAAAVAVAGGHSQADVSFCGSFKFTEACGDCKNRIEIQHVKGRSNFSDYQH